MDLNSKIKELSSLVELWCSQDALFEAAHSRLGEVSGYSLFPAGKRVRPLLCLLTAELLGLDAPSLRAFAVALELIHNSSLIHDDLPGLDDDASRRGKPSCHVAFGEGLAVLAGDILLARAFRLLGSASSLPPAVRAEWSELLGEATEQLCHGQAIDLDFSKGPLRSAFFAMSAAEQEQAVLNCHRKKTAALFQAAVLGPLAFLSSAGQAEVKGVFAQLGEDIGLAFQMTDDLLDSKEPSGAPSGMAEGMSIVPLLGKPRTLTLLAERRIRIAEALAPYGPPADLLRQFLAQIFERSA